jgi:hypothetical protein
MRYGHDAPDRDDRRPRRRPSRRLADRAPRGEQERRHRDDLRRRRHPLLALVHRARPPDRRTARRRCRARHRPHPARSTPTRFPASRHPASNRRWSSRSPTTSFAPSPRPVPCRTTGHSQRRPCTIAATKPSSASCGRPPSGLGSSSTSRSTTSTSSDAPSPSAAARAGGGESSGSARPPPRPAGLPRRTRAAPTLRHQRPVAGQPRHAVRRGRAQQVPETPSSLRRSPELSAPPARLRHTAAHRWLAAGGSESGLRPSPDGPAPTCSSAAPAPARTNAPPTKPGGSTWGISR